MIRIEEGQCGQCVHFGSHKDNAEIVEIRVNGEAPNGFVAGCGLPENATSHLRVSANSSCDGFQAHRAA